MPAKKRKLTTDPRPNRDRHERNCRICLHEERQAIENDFVRWKSPQQIASEYKLTDRSSIYRHAHAFDLFAARRRNIRAALERIIERADETATAVSGGAIVAAIQAYAKINSQGQWTEQPDILRDLFDRMTPVELEAYAAKGTLPDWFEKAVPASLTNANREEQENGRAKSQSA